MGGLEDANVRIRAYHACQYARKQSTSRGKRQSHEGCYCNSTAVQWINKTPPFINQHNTKPVDGGKQVDFQINDV